MHILKQLWFRSLRRAREEYEETQEEIEQGSPVFRFAVYGVIIYLCLSILVGIYWSFSPTPLNLDKTIQSVVNDFELSTNSPLPAGVATSSALIAVTETLWKKPGGYITNDIFPPGIWLDNMPSWEWGVLLQVRDTTQVLRSSFSQSPVGMQLDVDLQKAEVRFNFSKNSWVFPATESEYLAGVEYLQKYRARLIKGEDEDAHFYVDASHLDNYLGTVEQRLKNLSQRLTASIGPSVNTDAAAMAVDQVNLTGRTNGLYTKTPWHQLDDVFYEARGSSWALIALMQGVQIDYSRVLKNKNAQASYEQIIRELQPTQQTVYSPVILNGAGFGFVANHSLAMASYLARAQAAIVDCRRQLANPSL